MIALGWSYIANPYLVACLEAGVPPSPGWRCNSPNDRANNIERSDGAEIRVGQVRMYPELEGSSAYKRHGAELKPSKLFK
jgi:hypothetical protein